MTEFDDIAFPLLVIAQSERRSGVALFSRPLQLELARCTKKPVRNIRLPLPEPHTVLATHATRWRSAPRTTSKHEVPRPTLSIAVATACEFLACHATVQGAANRIIDAYPELERRLAPLTRAIGRSDTVRNTQPLVAAMIVAHAASVAHLMKHG